MVLIIIELAIFAVASIHSACKISQANITINLLLFYIVIYNIIYYIIIMSYFPAKKIINNEIPTIFNLNTFKTDALQSDNIITSILNAITQASLPTISNLASSPDITDNSNRIASQILNIEI